MAECDLEKERRGGLPGEWGEGKWEGTWRSTKDRWGQHRVVRAPSQVRRQSRRRHPTALESPSLTKTTLIGWVSKSLNWTQQLDHRKCRPSPRRFLIYGESRIFQIPPTTLQYSTIPLKYSQDKIYPPGENLEFTKYMFIW